MMSTNFKELAEYFDAGDFSEEARAAEPVKEPTGTAASVEPMDAFTVRLPVSVLEAVREIATEAGQTTGSIIRQMVEDAVAERASDEATVPVRALRELISLAQEPEDSRERTSHRAATRSAATARAAQKAQSGTARTNKTGTRPKVS